MTLIRSVPGWRLPESAATAEAVVLGRREFLRRAGLGAAGAAAILSGRVGPALGIPAPQERGPLDHIPDTPTAALYKAAVRDPRFTAGARHGGVSEERLVATYNNFYEFSTDKEAVWRLVDDFQARPWKVEIAGLVERPLTLDLVDLERRFSIEERIYRHRCVEAWSIVVPWSGFPLRDLIQLAGPTGSARYVRFVSFLRPDQAPGQRRQTWYPWPYFEALRLDEAMNELAFVVTGMYGHPLQKQNGAPIRIVTPWKYGYKSIKSIVRMELTESRPATFWNQLAPTEYGFFSNVDPTIPHPRWSQATERIVGSDRRIPTLPYNGYGEWVAQLYA